MSGFVILTGPRTGSTQFWRTLDEHPEVEAFGEVFLASMESPEAYPTFRGRSPEHEALAERDPAASYRAYLDELWTPRRGGRTVGFKVMYYDMPDELAGVLQERQPRFVHLVRTNSLKRRVSQVAAHQRGVFHVDSKKDVPTGRIRLDTSKLLKELRAREASVNEGRRFLESADHSLEITYEDMLGDRNGTFAKVFAFLGVEDREPAPAKLKKINPDSLRDIVENYDEVVELLRGTEFESNLE